MHSQDDRALRQLWALDAPSARGPKARWSLSEVAAAGVALADEVGLDGVSLARLAKRLEVTTTALYRYVDSKAVLIELMVDSAVGDAPTIAADDWRQHCRTWTTLLADRYAAHPWLSDVAPTRMPTQPHVYAWIDALVGAIGADTEVDPLRLALLLDSLVRTYMTLERNLSDAAPPAWLGEALSARFPRLAHAGRADAADARAELEFAVDAALRGVA
ncbi:helix-turn-helix domain containing protein [Microbacterium sp. STN6]|uniref:TetR/AcrR family transcriptional regulator n=1 Tax=Microbacterium sp. STN6 TaxID=2995588 RepID=UPI002260F94E|nr:helix-turn-helix domain-containing protein [Microbacterium sp. STN6]MCX7521061.1 helix-turn-helix domain containing protein [Microbacterium sp. STN6]